MEVRCNKNCRKFTAIKPFYQLYQLFSFQSSLLQSPYTSFRFSASPYTNLLIYQRQRCVLFLHYFLSFYHFGINCFPFSDLFYSLLTLPFVSLHLHILTFLYICQVIQTSLTQRRNGYFLFVLFFIYNFLSQTTQYFRIAIFNFVREAITN